MKSINCCATMKNKIKKGFKFVLKYTGTLAVIAVLVFGPNFSNIHKVSAASEQLQGEKIVNEFSEATANNDQLEKKSDTSEKQQEIKDKVDALHVPFMENDGQIENEKVKYQANLFSGPFFVTDDDLTYVLSKQNKSDAETTGPKVEAISESRVVDETANVQKYALKEVLLDEQGNPISFSPDGEDESSAVVSNFRGNDQSKWRDHLSVFNSLDLGNPWQDISMQLRASRKNVEKIFTVSPGGDPGRIKMGLQGASQLKISDTGELIVETGLGDITMTKPNAYQESNGQKIDIDVKYKIKGNNQYGFEVGSYDSELPLVIDPLLASTYIGGSASEANSGYNSPLSFISEDINGNIFLTCTSVSANYPTTSGAYDQTYNGGTDLNDVVISKFDTNLTTLQASTFYGGTGQDDVNGIKVDAGGNVYIVGDTGSIDLPMAGTPFSGSRNGTWDIFIAKLNNNLTSLSASTYLGTSDDYVEFGDSIAIGSNGKIYVAGVTGGDDFPMAGIAPGGWDFFLARLDSNLSSLEAATYLGGSSSESGQFPVSIALDTGNNVYLLGHTNSSNYPTTATAYDRTLTGSNDTVVSRFSSDLSTLLASTYIGGTGSDGFDRHSGIAIDSNGYVFINSLTSPSYPTTPGAYIGCSPNCGAERKHAISKFDANLTTLEASTIMSGKTSSYDIGGLAIDGNDNLFLLIRLQRGRLPVTRSGAYNRFQEQTVHISKLNNSLSTLLASTFFGGSGFPMPSSILIEPSGNVVIAGEDGTGLPTPENAYDRTNNGLADAFISKLDNNLSDASPMDHLSVGKSVLTQEGFEGATFPPTDWSTTGSQLWAPVTSEFSEGSASVKSGSIIADQQTSISRDFDYPVAGIIQFDWKVSSEENFDRFDFLIDGRNVGRIDGEEDWQGFAYPVSAGNHSFQWRYKKDGSANGGSDAGWLDNVRFAPNYHTAEELVGETVSTNLVAYDADGRIDRDYSGDKTVTLSQSGGMGAPTCTDKNGADVALGSSMTATFSDGVASCNLKNFETGSMEVDVSDGTYDSSGSPDYDLDLTSFAMDHLTVQGELGTTENFEGGTFPPQNWTTGGDADWHEDSSIKYSGAFSAASGDVNDSQSSWLGRNYTFANDDTIMFYWKVSSEEYYDYLRFYIDDVEVASISGEVNWTKASIPVTAGAHTLKWSYEKDESESLGSDTGWIDNISLYEYSNSISVTAGTNQTIIISALDNFGREFSSYTGDHEVTLSGPHSAGGDSPTCTDKNGNIVPFDTPTTFAFSGGTAVCTMVLYADETTTVDASDGTYDSSADPSYDLDVNVSGGSTPTSVDHLEITGSASQTAGSSQTITITARDSDGVTVPSYTGDHALTFSGAADAPNGTHPKVTDKNDADVNFGSAATLAFTDGVATTDMSLYKVEAAEIETTDGTYTTTGSPNYDLNVSVTVAATNAGETSISAAPTPGTVGTQETITVTAYDQYGNPRISGGDTVTLTVAGSNTATPSVTDNSNGTYTATYTPTNAGEDLITGTINSSAIGSDTDGTSDGTFHLTVQNLPMNHFVITGSASQTAGSSQTITITAKDTGGSTYVTYTGDHALTFSGATDSPDGTHPKVKDKTNADVNFGSAATITFVNGVATTDMALYKVENAEVETTDGTYTTTGSPNYDLNVDVTAAATNATITSISAAPTPGTVGTQETITVTAYDQYGNPSK